jgi:S-(hydroxymethyl)mycothiol dehydrogenase
MSAPREARALLMTGRDEPLAAEAIELDGPGPGEVQVRVEATGVCHSDLHIRNWGGMGMPFPILLGHEAAGTVEDVGEGVESLAPGARVVLTWSAPCGDCPECLRGEPRGCRGILAPGSRLRRASDGAVVTQALTTGTWSERTIVRAEQAVEVPRELPAEQACLLGCAVVTGVGAVLRTSPARAGSTVVVIGCGGVGLAAVQGARLAAAGKIVAVDVVEGKLEWARSFGATDVVHAGEQDPVEAVRALTDGGADFVYDVVGRPETLAQAVRMLGHLATATLVGVPPPRAEVTFPLDEGRAFNFWVRRATLRSCYGGEQLPAEDFPWLAQLALEGKLDLAGMVTKTIGLGDVEAAFEEMERGDVIRSVVLM